MSTKIGVSSDSGLELVGTGEEEEGEEIEIDERGKEDEDAGRGQDVDAEIDDGEGDWLVAAGKMLALGTGRVEFAFWRCFFPCRCVRKLI